MIPIPRAEAGCQIQRISVKNNTLHMSRRMTKPSPWLQYPGLRQAVKYREYQSNVILVIWATSWQNQQNDMCAQQRLWSAWASAQSDQSSQCAQWVAEDPMFLQADSEDYQTGRMPMLIWVFAGRTCHIVGFVIRWLIYSKSIWQFDSLKGKIIYEFEILCQSKHPLCRCDNRSENSVLIPQLVLWDYRKNC